MKSYSIFHPFWMSFYSKKLYVDVINNWKGRSFLYLLLLSAILTIPVTVQLKRGIGEMSRELPGIVKQIPEVRIIGGVSSTPQQRPYYIHEVPSGKLIGIIDTTGRHVTLENSDAKFLLSRTKIIYRQNEYETREYSIANVNDLTITNDDIYGWIDFLNSWLAILLAPFVFIGLYIYKIIAALLYSIIAIIIAALTKINVPYSSKLSLSIIAITPSSLVLAIIELLPVPVPQEFLFSLLVTTGFIIFGLVANKSELADH